MASANFFDKAAKAASHVIQGFDSDAFADQLRARTVGVAFDGAACRSREGRIMLELLVDLLSRLYPRLALRGSGAGAAEMTKWLKALARAINPMIEFGGPAAPLSVCVGIGRATVPTQCPRLYIGSDGWLAKLSPTTPVPPGATDNPIGAAAAACFAAANVFRILFAQSLPNARPDAEFVLSLLSLARAPRGDNPRLTPVDLGETHLVGVGAIGSAAVWTLSRLRLSGTLHLIDPETIELSNLQRYVGTTQSSVTVSKVGYARAAFTRRRSTVVEHAMRWTEYVHRRADYRFDRVAVALDNVPDRILVQGALPHRILNAWTQPGDLGVSRHGFVGHDACLACLYLPSGKEPDFDEFVATAIGLADDRMTVRALLYTNEPIGRDLLARIAQAKAVPLERLLPFEGKPLRVFYQETVCGSMVLPAASDRPGLRGAEVPMAFQSALAGVLLAAEIVADAGAYRPRPFPVATRINLLAPLAAVLNMPERKRPGDRCICQDQDYVAVFNAKYPKDIQAKATSVRVSPRAPRRIRRAKSKS